MTESKLDTGSSSSSSSGAPGTDASAHMSSLHLLAERSRLTAVEASIAEMQYLLMALRMNSSLPPPTAPLPKPGQSPIAALATAVGSGAAAAPVKKVKERKLGTAADAASLL